MDLFLLWILYAKKLTGNTVLHYHNVIRKALQSALKLDLILSNPADKTITIKHKAIETRKDNKRVILLKDKTKNQSSYRTLPLVDEIIVLLKEHKKQIDENKKLCGNSYNKKYLDYVCVDSTGKLFRPEYVTDHFTLIMKKRIKMF